MTMTGELQRRNGQKMSWPWSITWTRITETLSAQRCMQFMVLLILVQRCWPYVRTATTPYLLGWGISLVLVILVIRQRMFEKHLFIKLKPFDHLNLIDVLRCLSRELFSWRALGAAPFLGLARCEICIVPAPAKMYHSLPSLFTPKK